jgi:hypothetical protein
MYQIDLIDIYRVFHPTMTQFTFFSAAHGTFSEIDQILGHSANPNKCEKLKQLHLIRS